MKPLIGVLVFIAACAPGVLRAGDDDLAVVVNKSNPVTNLTKAQLKKMLLGEQSTWPGDKQVSLILRSPGQPERDIVLKSILGMSENDFNQHLLHSNFNGETGVPPKSLGSGAAVRQLVITLPGALGFLRMADVNDSVKVVTVDGLAAGQPGYALKAGN